MGEPRPPLTDEKNALKEAYAAFNRNDVSAFVQIFDRQIEWIEPAGFPGAGTYRGVDAVLAHLVKARETWAEGACQPEKMIVAGDRIIQFVKVRVRLKHETEWREGQVTEVYSYRDSKVIEVRLFGDRGQALEWAGVEALDAN
jgi:ketosteroid isomerase-like protein